MVDTEPATTLSSRVGADRLDQGVAPDCVDDDGCVEPRQVCLRSGAKAHVLARDADGLEAGEKRRVLLVVRQLSAEHDVWPGHFETTLESVTSDCHGVIFGS